MKVVLIFTYEALGLQYIASYLLANGHEVAPVFSPFPFEDHFLRVPSLARWMNLDREVVRRVVDMRPGLVGFSTMTPDFPAHRRLGRMIKSAIPDVPIVVGGIHPTLVPERVLAEDWVDYVCVGEGEQAMLDLCNRLEAREDPTTIANIWWRRDGTIHRNPVRKPVANLDELPFPEKELFYREAPFLRSPLIEYVMSTSRGCPFSCSYCYSEYMNRHLYRGAGFYRRRGVHNVLAEIEWMTAAKDVRFIAFLDDTFVVDKQWFQSFADEYLRRGYPRKFRIIINSRARFLDGETCRALKEMRCTLVEIGVQSGNEEIRRRILKRGGLDSNDEIIAACERLRRVGIAVELHHMHDLPGSTQEDLVESARLYNRCRPYILSQHQLVYFPRTSISTIALQRGCVSEAQLKDVEDGLCCDVYRRPQDEIRSFAFLFNILPMLDERTVTWLIESGAYRNRWLAAIHASIHRQVKWTRYLWLNLILRRDTRFFRYLLMYVNQPIVRLLGRKWASSLPGTRGRMATVARAG